MRLMRNREAPSPIDVPSFFRPDEVGAWSYRGDLPTIEAWVQDRLGEQAGLPAARAGGGRVALLLIDMQRDFCSPEGSLFVAGPGGNGAVEDTRRLVPWTYRNLAAIDRVFCTLDSHTPHQIFHPAFWRDRSGRPPEPFTVISSAALCGGEFTPLAFPPIGPELPTDDPDWLERQCLDYCRRLEAGGRHQLTIWPYHCLLGSSGHSLDGALHEVLTAWELLSGTSVEWWPKGSHPLTERYSALGPEVVRSADGVPLDQDEATTRLARLLEAETLVVAGQASSHCVRATLEDLVDRAADCDASPEIVALKDCMSPVYVHSADPTLLVDHSEETQAAFERLEARGVRFASSATYSLVAGSGRTD